MSGETKRLFTGKAFVDLCQADRFDDAVNMFLDFALQLSKVQAQDLNEEQRQSIAARTRLFLSRFQEPGFVISRETSLAAIDRNRELASLMLLSGFYNGDPFVDAISQRQGGLNKLLPFCFLTNSGLPDPEQLLQADSELAWRWFFALFDSWEYGLRLESTRKLLAVICDLISQKAEKLNNRFISIYYALPYLLPDRLGPVHRRLNKLLQEDASKIARRVGVEGVDTGWQPPVSPGDARRKTGRRKIGIVTEFCSPEHAVWRCQGLFLEALGRDHDLTLVVSREGKQGGGLIPRELVWDLWNREDAFVRISEEEFDALFFIDLGLSPASVLLANQRLAPLQVSGYGHPVSSEGAIIDFWLGGEAVEDAEHAPEFYSEQLLLLPGMTVAPASLPEFGADGNPAGKQVRDEDGPVLVNCPWGNQKLDGPMLKLLVEMAKDQPRPVRFRFFPGCTLLAGEEWLMRHILTQLFGEDGFELAGNMPPSDWTARVAEGHLALESHPFGCFNSTAECLMLGQPVVAFEGERAPARFTAAMLRRLGFEELIAHSREEYLALGRRLIGDAAWRSDLRDRLAGRDIRAELLAGEDPEVFSKAFDYLFALQNVHDWQARLAAPGRKTVLRPGDMVAEG